MRGWVNYFRWGNSAARFTAIDSYVHLRLAMLASAKHGLTGRHWASRFNHHWLAQWKLFRASGNVRWVGAHALR